MHTAGTRFSLLKLVVIILEFVLGCCNRKEKGKPNVIAVKKEKEQRNCPKTPLKLVKNGVMSYCRERLGQNICQLMFGVHMVERNQFFHEFLSNKITI